MTVDETLYHEDDGIAAIAINRPEKKNTLTNSVIQGIEDGIDRASRAKGFRRSIRDRDGPWGDYGQKGRED